VSNDVILRLAPLKWRGISLYVSQIETPFSHRQIARPYPYVDIPSHDHTGFEGVRPTATIHFLNTIEPGMYPDKWLEFRAAVFDGSSGPLEHPDLGEITARVADGSLRITAQSVAGITCTVTWVQTRDEVEDVVEFGTPGGESEEAAEAADEALAELDLDYPDGEPDTSLEGTIGAVEGGIFSLGQEIGGAINQAKGTLNKHLDALDLIGQAFRFADPATRDANAGNTARTVAETAILMMYGGLGKMADDAAKKARPVSVYFVKTPTPLAALATQLGNSIDEIITLNTSVAASPTVTAGAKIVYYVKA
jgi:prophage DNA circulation protein